MTKSSIPINGKKLTDRWGIETTDLLYIMMAHGLNVVDQYQNKVDIEDVLNDFKKNKDTSDYMFSSEEIKDIEAKLKVDGEIPHAETIRGEVLMTRWGKHEGEIHSIMFTHGLDAIEPFGHELELQRVFSLLADKVLEISDLLFRLSDIEDLESKHDELEPKQPEPEKDSDPDETEPIPESDQETLPVFSFYKNGDKWLIGKKGKERMFDHLDGFQYIQFLLRYEGETFDPVKLFYCGNVPEEMRDALYKGHYQKYGDPQYQINISNYKKELEIKLRETFKAEDKNELEFKIKQCEEFLKQARKGFGVKMKGYQVNIRKRIMTAYQRINKSAKEHKSLQPLLRYLCLDNPNKRIKTGNFIWYHQDPSDPVKWLLDPED
jgi:hypothetical protein